MSLDEKWRHFQCGTRNGLVLTGMQYSHYYIFDVTLHRLPVLFYAISKSGCQDESQHTKINCNI